MRPYPPGRHPRAVGDHCGIINPDNRQRWCVLSSGHDGEHVDEYELPTGDHVVGEPFDVFGSGIEIPVRKSDTARIIKPAAPVGDDIRLYRYHIADGVDPQSIVGTTIDVAEADGIRPSRIVGYRYIGVDLYVELEDTEQRNEPEQKDESA